MPEQLNAALRKLHLWIWEKKLVGYDPYDILNSPNLSSGLLRNPPFSYFFIQLGKRFGGMAMRRFMKVPESINPKAIALYLCSLCEMAKFDLDVQYREQIEYCLTELKRLRSPGEVEFCWGYDFDFMSIRGNVLGKYAPNSIATVFAGKALQQTAQVFRLEEAEQMAQSAARFLVTRLNRSINDTKHFCFSYTPLDRTVIHNSNALVCSFLAGIVQDQDRQLWLDICQRGLGFLADSQNEIGRWPYGEGRWQEWADNFHTAYNLEALMDYRETSGDGQFDRHLKKGFVYWQQNFFLANGLPKYYDDSIYPVDTHSCAQAILTMCHAHDLQIIDSTAGERVLQSPLMMALKIAQWTFDHMQNRDGSFAFQEHRYWIDRTPYMRWGQTFMLFALSRLLRILNGVTAVLPSR